MVSKKPAGRHSGRSVSQLVFLGKKQVMAKISQVIIISLVLILGLHFFANLFSWYNAIWWLDVLMHLVGGGWVALTASYVLFGNEKSKTISLLERVIMVIGIVALIGVLWEFYEYLSDVYLLKVHPLTLAPNPSLLPDTLKDLFNDLVGGTIIALLFARWFKS